MSVGPPPVPRMRESGLHSNILLKPGSLRDSLDARIRAALACGALQPIDTRQEIVEDAGVRFSVRQVSSLQRKEDDKRLRTSRIQNRENPRNPFLPPEPELTVTEISGTHIAVLNKFNVLERHLLIVTRSFEHQETLLGFNDFHALLTCMAEYDSLGFYNGGVVAGASQPHKHLQLVPLPLASKGSPVPMSPLLTGPGPLCERLAFPHSFRRLRAPIVKSTEEAAAQAQSLYLEMLSDIGIQTVMSDGEQRQSHPYNLLVTRDWILAVPRTEEFFQGISVNALGFVGSLFVKTQDQLDLIRREGPMRILRAVSSE